MSIPVLNVAKFILKNSGPLSNLKLQKLLYYVQGWHLALKGRPLFNEEIQAWVHGPVVPVAFRAYRGHGWQNIDTSFEAVTLSLHDARHIKDVLKVYGGFTGAELVRLSHSEEPWKNARPSLAPDETSQAVITHESMREFFASRAQA